MDESLPSPPSNLVQSNPQIAAALSLNHLSPMQPANQPDGFVPPNNSIGMGGPGPVRVQQVHPQMRAMPYPPPNMRQGQPPGGPQPHYSPMGIQPPQQFVGGGGGGQGGQGGPPMGQMQQRPPQMQPQMGGGGGPPMNIHPQHHPQQMQPPPNQQMQFVPNNPQMVQQQPREPVHSHQQQQHQPPQPQQPQQHHPQPSQQPPPQPPQQQQQPMTIQSSGPLGPIMEKSKLDDLMAQISSTTVLEESVKEVLVEYADDFVTAIIDKAAKMLQHREVKRIEGRDIEFILKNVYHMPVVPRSATHIFGQQSDMIDLSKEKHVPTEAHKQRVALLKKQLKKV